MREDAPLRMQVILIIALGFIVVGGTTDLILDKPQQWLTFHVMFEASMVAGALLIAVTLWLAWWRAEKSVNALTRQLNATQTEAVGRQFEEWQLTPTEREVALLLLQGHSHKSIAKQTSRSERTVRQHATAVYEKAGLGSRAELAAFFLGARIT